jgi:Plasmid recombination enzyme
MSVAKLTGAGKLLEAGRHNKREIQAEKGAKSHIDSSRCNLNYSLAGPDTAKEITELAKRLMADAGITTVRKDCVRAIEFLFSLPAGFAGDQRGFFTACLNWCTSRFGGVANVLSFDVHLDEGSPHAHCLLLPLVSGRMNGGKLVGNRKTFAEHHQTFNEQVGVPFGLKRAPARLTPSNRVSAAKLVIDSLKQSNDAGLQSIVWPTIRASIEANPNPFLESLGLSLIDKVKPIKSLASIMCKPQKMSKPDMTIKPKSIDFEAAKNHRSLSCVDFRQNTTPTPAPIADVYNRVSEGHIPVQNYDSDRGEFNQQAIQPDRESSGFWQVGDSINLSRKTFPTFESAQRAFPASQIIGPFGNPKPKKVIRFSLGVHNLYSEVGIDGN